MFRCTSLSCFIQIKKKKRKEEKCNSSMACAIIIIVVIIIIFVILKQFATKMGRRLKLSPPTHLLVAYVYVFL